MTQEQKDKMEQEVRAYTIPYIRNHGQRIGDIVKQDFTSIYQNILDNPSEWGLQDIEDSDERWCEVVDNFKQEAERYRRALEEITRVFGNPISSRIAKEALKQQDDKNSN